MPDPEANPRASLDAVVRGRVQGVGFRYFVLDLATELGLVGWVATQLAGSVRCGAEGPRAHRQSPLEQPRRAPRGGRVDDVLVTWGPPRGTFDRFSVRAGSHPGD